MGRLVDIDKLCDDLVKRWSIADKKKEDTIRAVMADVVTPIVVSQPTVDAIPVVHGHWIYHPEWVADGECGYECSECGRGVDLDYAYCPHCGARMDGKDGENNDTV